MTDAENLLWSKIRRKQLVDCQFYRQRIIGSFIVDFYCPKAKLVVEVDGGQHYNEPQIAKDKKREDYLQKLGMRVLRFSDEEILRNTSEVLEKIFQLLG